MEKTSGSKTVTLQSASRYLFWFLLFSGLTFFTLYLIHRNFSTGSAVRLTPFLPGATIPVLLLLFVLYISFDLLRLYFILRTLGARVPLWSMVKLTFINIFISGATPLATGGGFAQVYFLSRYKVPVGKGVAATSIRTAIAALIIFGSVPLILVTEKGLHSILPVKNGLLYASLMIGLYLAGFFLIIARMSVIRKMALGVIRFLRKIKLLSAQRAEKAEAAADKVLQQFSSSVSDFMKGSPVYILLSILCTLVFLFLLFWLAGYLIRILNGRMHIVTLISLQLLITFLMYFTPTPGATGVAEGGFALIYSKFIPGEYVFTVTFLWRFFTIYLGMLIGMFIFYIEVWRYHGKKKKT